MALPARLPHVFTGVRWPGGGPLIVIIASEKIGSVSGLGYMVLTAQQTFRVERVFAGIVIIGVLGFATDQGMWALQRWLVPGLAKRAIAPDAADRERVKNWGQNQHQAKRTMMAVHRLERHVVTADSARWCPMLSCPK